MSAIRDKLQACIDQLDVSAEAMVRAQEVMLDQAARVAKLEASLAKANDAWLALSQVQSSQPVIDKSMVKRLAVQHGLSAGDSGQARKAALEEAAKACEALEERISNAMVDANERSGTPIDGGYLNACDDCADAIRALGEPIQGEPT